MYYKKYLNPFYLYKNRRLIVPFIVNLPHRIQAKIKYGLASKGIYITENEKKLAALKNRHVGKRCFVVGNGPSLSIEDLDRLQNEITFASNKIYLAFQKTDWRPTYYGVEDDLVAKQNHDRINSLTSSLKLFPYYLQFFVPPFDNGLYFNLIYYDFYPGYPRFGTDAISGIYWGSTITYTFLQLAAFMGIRRIYLLGVDFHFIVPGETYNNQQIVTSIGEINHFHPEYRKSGEKWNVPNLHFQEKSYVAAKKNFEAMGGHIFNATRGGKLEIFKRVNFDSLF